MKNYHYDEHYHYDEYHEYYENYFDKEEQQSTVLFTLLLIVSLLVTTVTGGVCKLFVDDPITIPTLDYQAMMLMIKTLFYARSFALLA